MTIIEMCPHCGRTFASPNGLAVHIGRTHGSGTPARPAASQFPCTECPDTFDSPQKRGAHRRRAHPKALPASLVKPEPAVKAEGPKLVTPAEPIERRPFDPQELRNRAADTIYLDDAG